MVAIDEGWSAWADRELKRNGGAAPDPVIEPIKHDIWDLGGIDDDDEGSKGNSTVKKKGVKSKGSEAKRRWGKMKMMGIKTATVLKSVNQAVHVDPMERGRRELMEFAFGAVPLPQPSENPVPFRLGF